MSFLRRDFVICCREARRYVSLLTVPSDGAPKGGLEVAAGERFISERRDAGLALGE